MVLWTASLRLAHADSHAGVLRAVEAPQGFALVVAHGPAVHEAEALLQVGRRGSRAGRRTAPGYRAGRRTSRVSCSATPCSPHGRADGRSKGAERLPSSAAAWSARRVRFGTSPSQAATARIRGALQHSPKQRQTAEVCMSDDRGNDGGARGPYRTDRPWGWIVGILAVIVVAAGLWWLGTREEHSATAGNRGAGSTAPAAQPPAGGTTR